jgi:hypothetical protein
MNNNSNNQEAAYSNKLRAGKRRTYFFDIRNTKNNDYYLTITESRKKLGSEEFERNKIYVYKEDVNRFVDSITQAVNFLKTELLPNYDFDSFQNEEFSKFNNSEGQNNLNSGSVESGATENW